MTAPWCQNEGFAPGTQNGGQAWEKVGHCDGTISPTVSPTTLEENSDDTKKACQFKYKLETTSRGEYVILQAESWKKGGTTIATVSGGTPLNLYTPGHLVRDGRDARKCNSYPYSLYCSGWSPFVPKPNEDPSNYNPAHSSQGWDIATCEDVESTDQAGEVLSGKNDEFVSNLGPVFASNGDLLVKTDGTCNNLAINPQDYFKPSPTVEGCQKCATDHGFGSRFAPKVCIPCQIGTIGKIVDGKSQCMFSINGASDEPSLSPSDEPSAQPVPTPAPTVSLFECVSCIEITQDQFMEANTNTNMLAFCPPSLYSQYQLQYPLLYPP
eukprot:scaffold2371_cov153-Skeletonema_dohrnii-CCMP3373.AAC.1